MDRGYQIGLLNRRADHLKKRLLDTPDHRGRSWDVDEEAALRYAVSCMSAMGKVDDLVNALRLLLDGKGTAERTEALVRARVVLQEWE